ncbi:MAG TPA: hypothetical protein GXZ89_00950 [Fastidiosipila sp.]|nr:hypothetical protein [Fastidiosipila sp.]
MKQIRAATDTFIESIDEDLNSTTTDYTWFAKNDRIVTLENAIYVFEAWSKSGESEASFLIGPISDLEKHKLVMEFQERFPDNSLHLSDMELLLVVTRSGIPR